MAATLKSRVMASNAAANQEILSSETEPEKAPRIVTERVRFPKWWGDLPTTAKWDDEVEWVHQNRALVIETTTGGKMRMAWEKEQSKPPSWGAVAMMEDAAADPRGFRDTLLRAKKGASEEEEGLVREEKKGIAEVERIIDQMLEGV